MSYQNDILEATSIDLPWDNLDGCNLLITGATGLIGSCLVDVLMNRKEHRFVVYAMGRDREKARVRFNDYWDDDFFRFIEHDVSTPLGGDIDFRYIIHAASNASPSFFLTNPVEIVKTNILGLSNLIDYGLKHKMKRLLYISSGEVYGEGDGRVFTEDYCGHLDFNSLRSCYPGSKRVSESLCVAYGEEYNADIVIARPCHIYGPFFTENDNRVYAQFIRNILDDKDIILKSSGEQLRSWCYVVDCVAALLFVLLKGEKGQAYNIADESSQITIRQLGEMIAEIGNKRIVFETPLNAERAVFNPMSQSVFSTAKIKELGWTVRGNMRDKICSTIRLRLSMQK